MSEVNVTWRRFMGLSESHAFIDDSYNTVCGIPAWRYPNHHETGDGETCPECKEKLAIIKPAMASN